MGARRRAGGEGWQQAPPDGSKPTPQDTSQYVEAQRKGAASTLSSQDAFPELSSSRSSSFLLLSGLGAVKGVRPDWWIFNWKQ